MSLNSAYSSSNAGVTLPAKWSDIFFFMSSVMSNGYNVVLSKFYFGFFSFTDLTRKIILFFHCIPFFQSNAISATSSSKMNSVKRFQSFFAWIFPISLFSIIRMLFSPLFHISFLIRNNLLKSYLTTFFTSFPSCISGFIRRVTINTYP